jgi:hypothetical protein
MGQAVIPRRGSLSALLVPLLVAAVTTTGSAQIQQRANPSTTRRVAITPPGSDQTVCFEWDDATQKCNKVPKAAPFDLAFPSPGSIPFPVLPLAIGGNPFAAAEGEGIDVLVDLRCEKIARRGTTPCDVNGFEDGHATVTITLSPVAPPAEKSGYIFNLGQRGTTPPPSTRIERYYMEPEGGVAIMLPVGSWPAGAYDVEAIADPGASIPETDEKNNRYALRLYGSGSPSAFALDQLQQQILPLGPPDLVVDAAYFGSGEIEPGIPFQVYPLHFVQVRNATGGGAGASKVRLSCTRYDASDVSLGPCYAAKVESVPALAGLEEWYLAMNFSNKHYCEAARCVTEVHVDPYSAVEESNESNNTVTRAIE